MRIRGLSLSFLLIGFPALAGADAIADLSARLKSLQPQGIVKARIEMSRQEVNGENKEASRSGGDSTESVVAELGADGLRMAWSAEQIAAARESERAEQKDPDSKQRRTVLGRVPAREVADLLDGAEPLLLLLDGAVVVEEKPDSRNGRTAHLLVVTPKNTMRGEEAKMVKSYDDVLKLWLDEDGFPIASERSTKVKARKFLISFGFENRVERDYQRASGRLIVTRQSEESAGEGLGEKGGDTKRTTVTLLP